MGKVFIISLLILVITIPGYAQTGVAINTTGAEPDGTAMLDVSSTEKGILVPRMTEFYRLAISNPAKGLMVYQNDGTEGFYYYTGSSWTRLANGIYTETDPVFGTSAAHGITSTNITNWNTAYGWGNHAGLYRPIGYVPSWSEITSNPFSFSSVANNQLLKYNSTSSKWENWTPNYLTNYNETQNLADVISINNSANGQIKDVTDPSDDHDATTKEYVDALKAQLSVLEDMLIETGTYKIFDADSNIYSVVKIGSQLWMDENLKTSKYNDGTSIPNVTDNTEWSVLTTPAYAWSYNNYETNGIIYGALYNWFCVDTGSNGDKNICPKGWHVPTQAEWNILINYLSGSGVAGGKLKSTRTDPDPHPRWDSPNTGATNETGFAALPCGYRYYTGVFAYLGSLGFWWSSTETQGTKAYDPSMSSDGNGVNVYSTGKTAGVSIRCLRD